MSLEEEGQTARFLFRGPAQLSESLTLRAFASVSAFAPWQMVVAVLYTSVPFATKLEPGATLRK